MLRILIFSIVFLLSLAYFVDSKKTEEQCNGEFEFWSCQSSTRQCQRICENKGADRKTNCKGDCEKACVCEAGYLRDGPDGECVYETECPNFNPETGKNENVAKSSSNPSATTQKPSIGSKLAKAKSQTAPKAKTKKREAYEDQYDHSSIDDGNDFIVYELVGDKDTGYDLRESSQDYQKEITDKDDDDHDDDHESDDDGHESEDDDQESDDEDNKNYNNYYYTK